MNLLVILGDQLFNPDIVRSHLGAEAPNTLIFMREDVELCTRYKFHKHKLIFFLSSMRNYAAELKKCGFQVHYESLPQSQGSSYEDALKKILSEARPSKIFHFEIEDRFFEQRLTSLFDQTKISVETWRSPMFVTTRDQFALYQAEHKRPFMKTFYQWQRRRLKILVDHEGQPLGGRWSFDEDNRKALPKKISPEPPLLFKADDNTKKVSALVKSLFNDHPGDIDNFWLPTERRAAKKWLDDFCLKRLSAFGPYEDALAPHSDFVFHSVLTPFLNVGWLTPSEVIKRVLTVAKEINAPMNSLEGFIRQVIGWREFIRGIYRGHGQVQEQSNFWDHHRGLARVWYEGGTGVPPLDQVVLKSQRYGYAHHIERLMVAGNLMLLLGVHPQHAYRWFMEMFVDSADWVMGPNVFGMALFSDGGVFATKPYICGSNYFIKMGGYAKGDWQEGVDGLYWGFIGQNKKFFSGNPRLSMIVKTFDKMNQDRKQKLAVAADQLRQRLTI